MPLFAASLHDEKHKNGAQERRSGERAKQEGRGSCMSSTRNEARGGLRGGASAIAIIAAALVVSSNDANAKRHRHVDSSYHPPSASIVVDANSGAVLYSASADELRHPASLTKIMTLYLLFEQLDAGKLRLDSPFRVSEHAAGQNPTKLGLKPGSTLAVEDAIKGMVTRSANDAAVVVAENLGGSEEQFAALMTRKARALGMSRTVYRNASGLPNDEQVTTARDQSILGRAIQEHFPVYYRYFQTRTFAFHGQSIGNHNHLLGTVDGVDGIKTGYTEASGYNLVTSVHRNGRYLVAVVLGGVSGSARDERMRQLIETNIKTASVTRGAPTIAEASAKSSDTQITAVPAVARPGAKDPERYTLADAKSVPANKQPVAAAGPVLVGAKPGSTEPIRPVLVKTVNVRPSSVMPTTSANPLQFTQSQNASDQSGTTAPQLQAAKTDRLAAAAMNAPQTRVAAVEAREVAPTPVSAVTPPRSGWMIQVGAYSDEKEAKQKLASVKTKAGRLLASAAPVTEAVQKDGSVFYRARFAGFDKEKAEAVCKFLKRNDIVCLTIKN
jgi:D-alanyl-D-alanine carboxypeptidase